MSLVNDALKRAKQAQQENPPPVPPLQFRPVEPANEAQPGSPVLIVGAVLGLMVLIGLGGLLVWAVAGKQGAALQVEARTVVQPAPVVAPAKTVTNVEPVVVEPPQPELKLQGIFFNPRSPSAVVNGRTLYVGDRVGGLSVTAITPKAVTLTSKTLTNVLSLSE